ncbi:MAG: hypothetical protein DRP15_00900 [Candidatus Aenigmatarchaeota archaeon]|nr:MAG: hypothetical protein DRP15_00900 [Candidatus Aenigmarchaeota archaeon]
MKPYSTRKWHHPEGYKFLAVWTNAVLLRFLIRKFTKTLPPQEHRTKTQLDDSARSVVSNIEEGYKRPTTSEYLEFLGFSQASLEEIKGLIRQVYQDGFLKSKPHSSLADLGIDLKEVKALLKDSKGNIPLDLLYPPLKSLNSPLSSSNNPKGFAVTLEMFLELINKTDYLFRQTVHSLEQALDKEEALSPYQKWLGRKIAQERKKDQALDKELIETLRKEGKIFTSQGFMDREKAEKLGLPEIEIP